MSAYMIASWLVVFTFVFARVAGLIMTASMYGAGDVPLRVRVLLAVGLALVVVPIEGGGAASFAGLPEYAIGLAVEAAIGASLGLGVLVLLHGMTMAGALVAQSSGLGLAEVFDPATEENVPLFSRLMFLAAVAIFLCIGGHRVAMAGLLDTFRTMPPGGGRLPDSLAGAFTTLVTQSFSLGVRVAAPAVTALLLATLILGMIGRALPQMNVFSLGFGANSFLALAALALAFAAVAWAFQDQIEPALRTIFDALKTPLKTEWMM
jgi:flagellar biosynthesis protein FliR